MPAEVEVVTFEFENVPAETAAVAAERAPVRPSGRVLHVCQQRLREKSFLREAGRDGHRHLRRRHCRREIERREHDHGHQAERQQRLDERRHCGLSSWVWIANFGSHV